MKRKTTRIISYSTAFAFVVIAALAINVLFFKPITIDLFFMRSFAEYVWQKPEKLTEYGFLEPFGITGHNSKLNDYSVEAKRSSLAFLHDLRDKLKAYPRENYSGKKLLSYDVFQYYIDDQIEGEPWLLYGFPVNQFFGIHTDLPNFMTHQHGISDAKSAQQYLERLEQFPRAFAETIAALKESEAQGIYPPRFAIEKSLDQMLGFIQMPARENVLYQRYAKRLSALVPDKISTTMQAELQQRAAEIIENAVYPAYQELIEHQRSLLSIAFSNDGVWRLPRGDEYYDYLVRKTTTLDLSAEEVHQTGLNEVARIVESINTILVQLGYTEGSIGTRLLRISLSEEQQYNEQDQRWRDEALHDFQSYLDTNAKLIEPYFNQLPKAHLEVLRIPAYEEKTRSVAYYKASSTNGSRPGRVFVNLNSAEQMPRYCMRTLANHEGTPGHHLQSALVQENGELPLFRRYIPFSVYGEGWAMYAERLTWEIGGMPDTMDNLCRLRSEMLRAVRLVVDTGLHRRRWTREQAIQYLREYTGISEDEAIVEIERYLTHPANALSYTIGMLNIIQLRNYAQQALGDSFDLRAFHDQILGPGELPLPMLERHVHDWVSQQQSINAQLATNSAQSTEHVVNDQLSMSLH